MTMINQKVLMSGAEYFNDDFAINPYMDAEVPVNIHLATAEHASVAAALQAAGVTIEYYPAPEGCQDGVYTANWALCRGNKAILSSLPNARQAEQPHAKKALQDRGFEVIEAPYRFSGQGDALPCGNYLFMGSEYRTDPRMHQFVADTLGHEVISLQTIPQLDINGQPQINSYSGWPDSFFYDIDLALSILKAPSLCDHGTQALDDSPISSRETDRAVPKYGEGSITEKNRASAKEAGGVIGSADKQASCPECRGLIAWCPEAFTPESQEKLRALPIEKIEVSLDEAMKGFACNLVSTGETVVMSAHAPQFQAAIEAKGLKTITPEIQELAKGGGYIRCTTLTLVNK